MLRVMYGESKSVYQSQDLGASEHDVASSTSMLQWKIAVKDNF